VEGAEYGKDYTYTTNNSVDNKNVKYLFDFDNKFNPEDKRVTFTLKDQD
jgi:hypothetical protein